MKNVLKNRTGLIVVIMLAIAVAVYFVVRRSRSSAPENAEAPVHGMGLLKGGVPAMAPATGNRSEVQTSTGTSVLQKISDLTNSTESTAGTTRWDRLGIRPINGDGVVAKILGLT